MLSTSALYSSDMRSLTDSAENAEGTDELRITPFTETFELAMDRKVEDKALVLLVGTLEAFRAGPVFGFWDLDFRAAVQKKNVAVLLADKYIPNVVASRVPWDCFDPE